MLIESLLMRTPFVAFIWKDTKHVTNMRAVFQNYIHFRGIDRISALLLNYDSKDLLRDLVSALEKKTKIDKNQLDNRKANYFYTIHRDKFCDRLDKQVQNIGREQRSTQCQISLLMQKFLFQNQRIWGTVIGARKHF